MNILWSDSFVIVRLGMPALSVKWLENSKPKHSPLFNKQTFSVIQGSSETEFNDKEEAQEGKRPQTGGRHVTAHVGPRL